MADTRLEDYVMRDIARPNNDTFSLGALQDLRNGRLRWGTGERVDRNFEAAGDSGPPGVSPRQKEPAPISMT